MKTYMRFLFVGIMMFSLSACGATKTEEESVEEVTITDDSTDEKGGINNPYALGDSFEVTAYNVVPYSAYTPEGRKSEKPIRFEISNIQVIEQQKYSSYEDGKTVEHDNYYLVAFDLEVLESSVTETTNISLDYLQLHNLNSNGQEGNDSLSSWYARIPDGYIYYDFQSLMPLVGAKWNFAEVIYTKDDGDLTYIVFNYCDEDGEYHDIFVSTEGIWSNTTSSEEKGAEQEKSIGNEMPPEEKKYQTAVAAEEKGYYTIAKNIFGDILEYQDAQEHYNTLDNFLKEYDGVYYGESTQFQNVNVYLYIKDGIVTVQFEGRDKIPDVYELYLYGEDKENDNAPILAFAPSLTELFTLDPSIIYGEGYAYVIQKLNDGTYIVGATEGSNYHTFNGFYEKQSTTD